MTQIKIDVVEDESQFGHARIIFLGNLPRSPDPRLLITRKSLDAPNLGETGNWQASPAPLAVRLVTQTSDRTVFLAGPQICDNIAFELQVRIQLAGSDIYGEVFWPDIAPSVGGYTSPIGLADKPAQKPIVVPPIEEPEPSPEPVPVEEQEPPAPVPPTPPVPEPEVVVPKPRRSKAWLYILFLLLIAGGMAAYIYRDPIMVAINNMRSPQETLAQKFERLKNSDRVGDDLLALSLEAYKASDRDIGMKAIDLAIQRKNQKAKLEKAKWYDPRTFASDRVNAADANMAARSYFEIAKETGNSSAQALLVSLCAESRNRNSSHAADFSDFLGDFYCGGN